jgi:hypothetical protein
MPSTGNEAAVYATYSLFRINVEKLWNIATGEIDDALFIDGNASKSMDRTFYVILKVAFLIRDFKQAFCRHEKFFQFRFLAA